MTDDPWMGWNGRALNQLDARVQRLEAVPETLARMEGKIDVLQQRRWSPSAKSGLAAACVVATPALIALLLAGH